MRFLKIQSHFECQPAMLHCPCLKCGSVGSSWVRWPIHMQETSWLNCWLEDKMKLMEAAWHQLESWQFTTFYGKTWESGLCDNWLRLEHGNKSKSTPVDLTMHTYRTMYGLWWISNFSTQVRWFFNDFHEWHIYEWRSMANHHTSAQKWYYSC